MASENEKDLIQEHITLATLTEFNTGRQQFSLSSVFAEAVGSLFTSDMVVNTAVEYFQLTKNTHFAFITPSKRKDNTLH